MAPPNWAYQVENFDPPADEELICSICRAVFCDPAQCPCNHVFCRVCISKWLQSNKNCPVCRKRATRSSIQDVVPLIKNMILKLTLRCRNCKDGCEEKFNLETCENHMKTCMYETVKCKNESCSEEFLRKDIENHEHNECLYRCIKCTTCSLKISKLTPQKHSCIRDLKKALKEKNSIIKERNQVIEKQNEKIVQLTAEVKSLKSSNRNPHSDTSSLESLSTADIMISLADLASFSSDSSLTQTASDDNDYNFGSWVSDIQPQPTDRILTADEVNVIIERAREESNGVGYSIFDIDAINAAMGRDSDTPREFHRTSSPAIENSALTLPTLSDQDSPGVRRPAKRRHALRALSHSEDNSDEDVPSRSNKRSWKINIGKKFTQSSSSSAATNASSNTQSDSCMEAGPSFRHSQADSNDSSSSASKTKYSTRSRQGRNKKKSNTKSSSSVLDASNGRAAIFRRTIELLERYNLESDPEWKPEYSSHRGADITSDSDESTGLETDSSLSSTDSGDKKITSWSDAFVSSDWDGD